MASDIETVRRKFAEYNTKQGINMSPSDVVIVNKRARPKTGKYTKITDEPQYARKKVETITVDELKGITKETKIMQDIGKSVYSEPTAKERFFYNVQQAKLQEREISSQPLTTGKSYNPYANEPIRQEQQITQKEQITPIQKTYLKSYEKYAQKRENVDTRIDQFFGKIRNQNYYNESNLFFGQIPKKTISGTSKFFQGFAKSANPYQIPETYTQINLFAVSPNERKQGIKGARTVLTGIGTYALKNPLETSGMVAGGVATSYLTTKSYRYAFKNDVNLVDIEKLQFKKQNLETIRKQLIIENKDLKSINKEIFKVEKDIKYKENLLKEYNIGIERKEQEKVSKQPNIFKKYFSDKILEKEIKNNQFTQAKADYGTFKYEPENIPLLKKTESGQLIKVDELNKPIQLFDISGQPTGLQRQLSPKDIDIYENFQIPKIQEQFKKSTFEKQTQLFKEEKIDIYKKTETGQKVKTSEIKIQKPLFVNLGGIPIIDLKFKSSFDYAPDLKTTSINIPEFQDVTTKYKYTSTFDYKPKSYIIPKSEQRFENINLNNLFTINKTGTLSKQIQSQITIPKYKQKIIVENIYDLQTRQITKQNSSQIQKVQQITEQKLKSLTIPRFDNYKPIKQKSKSSFKYIKEIKIKEPIIPFFPKIDKKYKSTEFNINKKYFKPIKIKDNYKRLVIPDLYSVNITELRTGKEAISPTLTKGVRKRAKAFFKGESFGYVPTEYLRQKARL